jgi:hypothetical protein
MYSLHAWPAAACHPALQPGSPVAPHHAAQQPSEKQRQQQCPPEASDCVQAARLHIAVEKVGVHKQSLQGRQGWGRTGRTCRADRVSQQRGLLALSMPAPASQPARTPVQESKQRLPTCIQQTPAAPKALAPGPARRRWIAPPCAPRAPPRCAAPPAPARSQRCGHPSGACRDRQADQKSVGNAPGSVKQGGGWPTTVYPQLPSRLLSSGLCLQPSALLSMCG